MNSSADQPPMGILSFDCSQPVSCAAVVVNGKATAHECFESGGMKSSTLLGAIDRVLKSAGGTLDSMQAVAVGKGPGSFTGLRVAVATAKGLVAPRKLNLVAVPTLQAVAFGCSTGERPVMVVMDARRGQLYCAVYETTPGGPGELVAPIAVEPKKVADLYPGDLVVAGNGVEPHRRLFNETFGGRATLVTPYDHLRTVVSLARLAEERLRTAGPDDPDSVAPEYVRPPDVTFPKKTQFRNPR